MNIAQQIKYTQDMMAVAQQPFHDRIEDLSQLYLAHHCPFIVGSKYIMPDIKNRSCVETEPEHFLSQYSGQVFGVHERHVVFGEQANEPYLEWKVVAYLDNNEHPWRRRFEFRESDMCDLKQPHVVLAEMASV